MTEPEVWGDQHTLIPESHGAPPAWTKPRRQEKPLEAQDQSRDAAASSPAVKRDPVSTLAGAQDKGSPAHRPAAQWACRRPCLPGPKPNAQGVRPWWEELLEAWGLLPHSLLPEVPVSVHPPPSSRLACYFSIL